MRTKNTALKRASQITGLLYGVACLTSLVLAGTIAAGEDGGARSGNVIVSHLGRNWTLATDSASWPSRRGPSSVVYDGKIWIMGGRASSGLKNDVWYSADGATWTSATLSADWSGRSSHSSVVYDGKIWVIGGTAITGRTTDVWYSTDGATWTSATLSAPWSDGGGPSVVHDGKMWVVGWGGGVWSSVDGATWTPATLTAPWSVDEDLEPEDFDWSTRGGYAAVVHDGKIWVLGGAFGSRSVPDAVVWKNDVWYSEDGENWTQATESAPWSVRAGHASVAADGKIWVIGGQRATFVSLNSLNDVWYSTDGENWTAATGSAAWSGRGSHSSVVYDEKIWVIGGLDDVNYRNDVWHSPPMAGASSWMRYR